MKPILTSNYLFFNISEVHNCNYKRHLWRLIPPGDSGPRKGSNYTLLLEGGLSIQGYPWRIRKIIDPPHPGWTFMIKKCNRGSRWLSNHLGSTSLNTSSLDLRGPKIKDPVVGTTWLGFHLQV